MSLHCLRIRVDCSVLVNKQTGGLWARAPSSLRVCTGWSKPSLIKNAVSTIYSYKFAKSTEYLLMHQSTIVSLFANILDPDQTQQEVEPDLCPTCLKLIYIGYLESIIMKQKTRTFCSMQHKLLRAPFL